MQIFYTVKGRGQDPSKAFWGQQAGPMCCVAIKRAWFFAMMWSLHNCHVYIRNTEKTAKNPTKISI